MVVRCLSQGDATLTRLLLENGARFLHRDLINLTALHYAAYLGKACIGPERPTWY